jgi:hypothetical protein
VYVLTLTRVPECLLLIEQRNGSTLLTISKLTRMRTKMLPWSFLIKDGIYSDCCDCGTGPAALVFNDYKTLK